MPYKETKDKIIKKISTPIVDFILQNKELLTANFHAMPFSMMRKGMKGYDKYNALFGHQYFSSETTVSGKIFDSFFYPTKCIKKSQDNTAKLFGAMDTLFVTCGTSIANQIVVDALVDEKSRVLMDRQAHQSMHFSVSNRKASIHFFYSQSYCLATEKNYVVLDEIIANTKESVDKQQPYDVIILTAASYDGVILNVYKVISEIIKILPKAKFIIDEAWTSAYYFHKDLYKFTAGYAAKQLNYKIDIVSTQSAHKSLMTLRQASYIHSFAGDEVTHRLYKSRFKLHSTSPNYGILASMDLAASHMYTYGEQQMKDAVLFARHIRDSLDQPELNEYKLNENEKESIEKLSGGVCVSDPLKIHINIRHLGMHGPEIQEYFYHHYGLYFNRYTKDCLLFNIHIGIQRKHVDKLISSLKIFNSTKQFRQISKIKTNEFIISYPPGIPLHTPGESIANDMYANINGKIQNGINVFQLT